MKITDLKVKNIVSHSDYSDCLAEVLMIDAETMSVNTMLDVGKSWINHINLIEPVPISHELLKRIGFNNVVADQWYNLNYGYIREVGDHFIRCYYDNNTEYQCPEEYRFIHEIQNLEV